MEPNFVQIQAAYLRGIEYKQAIVEVEVSDGTIRDNIKSEYVERVDKIMIGANMVVAQDGSAAFDNLRTLINIISNTTKDYA